MWSVVTAHKSWWEITRNYRSAQASLSITVCGVCFWCRGRYVCIFCIAWASSLLNPWAALVFFDRRRASTKHLRCKRSRLFSLARPKAEYCYELRACGVRHTTVVVIINSVLSGINAVGKQSSVENEGLSGIMLRNSSVWSFFGCFLGVHVWSMMWSVGSMCMSRRRCPCPQHSE